VSDTTDDLIQRLRHRHGQVIDLGLERVLALLNRVGDPHLSLAPVVHVAGTNGKGSLCAYVKAMLEASGRRVGVYTSPHLVRFHERIALPAHDGVARPIDDAALRDILREVDAVAADLPVTFFEATTAAAFLAFARTDLDAVILEVGVGGRLDATNVVERPALTVITPIALDHMALLGDSIDKIAAEKGGILKRGVPAVIARQTDAALDVLRRTARSYRTGRLVVAGEDYDAIEQHGRLVYEDDERLLDLPLPSLSGRHQVENAGLALATALALPPSLRPDDTAIGRGLKAARWPARLQRLASGRLAAIAGQRCQLWLDGAHNGHAAEALAAAMARMQKRAPRDLGLVVGMLQTKDASAFFAPFRGLARRVLAVQIPGDRQSADPLVLARTAQSSGLSASVADSVEDAVRRIATESAEPTRILISGSLHLAGAVLAAEQGVLPHPN
jgi:dihydrofolate synthase/folylpolyglutamate synthase